MTTVKEPFDAILIVSFGGPEGPDDVMPFLENVLRGKRVPRERMLEVAEHYQHFGGVSPINEQNRDLISALKEEISGTDVDLPIYWGNRNWKPFITDALEEMKRDGKKRAIAFFTSMFSCYSGCRQYRENIADARQEVGDGAPHVELVRKGFNHPGFVSTQVQLTQKALAKFAEEDRSEAHLLFTAHSIPMSMAEHSRYTLQLNETAKLVAKEMGHDSYELVFQSRSGPPQQPWLEPDVCDRIEELVEAGKKNFVVIPIGFVSDHMEVMFDLDTEAKDICEKHGVGFSRAETAGTHPDFISMIRELIQERVHDLDSRPAVGELGPSHDICPVDCCLYPTQRPPAAAGGSRPS